MNKQKSFTLIELLVVIVIIGILAGVIMISTSSSINKANIAKLKVFEENVNNDLAANMVSRWKLDEINGTSTPNAWGLNTGTLGDGITSTTYPILLPEIQCINNKCMEFDGINDYIECYSNTIPSPISVGVWAKANGDGSEVNDTILRWGGSITPLTGIRLIRTHINQITAWFQSSLGTTNMPTTSMPLNTWIYIVFTHDKNKANLYINGLLIGSPVVQNMRDIIGNVYIGRYHTIEVPFKGLIDDVRIYNAALSSSKIKQNYVAGLDSLLSKNSLSKEDYNQRIESLGTR